MEKKMQRDTEITSTVGVTIIGPEHSSGEGISGKSIRDMGRDRATQSKRHWLRLLRVARETGARLSELLTATWSEFDMSRNVWVIPSLRGNAQPQVLMLSKAAIRSLKAMRLMADPASERVFHSIARVKCPDKVFQEMMHRIGERFLRFNDLRKEALLRNANRNLIP